MCPASAAGGGLHQSNLEPPLARFVASTGPTCSLLWLNLWTLLTHPAASTGPTCGLHLPDLWPPLAQPAASTSPTHGVLWPDPWPLTIWAGVGPWVHAAIPWPWDAQCLLLAVG